MSADRDYAVPTAGFTPGQLRAWDAIENRWAQLLERRRAELKVPVIPFQPTDDDVMVFRMQAKEQTTEGGIVIPDHTYVVDQDERTLQKRTVAVAQVLNYGLLLEAGLSARDWMRSHGYLIGDIVKWGRYAGEEESVHWFTGGGVQSVEQVLLINARDLKGSFDLDHRLRGPEPSMRIVFVADGAGNGMHIVRPIVKEDS